MADFADSNYSFEPFDRFDSVSVGELIHCLKSGNEAFFYQMLITLRDQASEIAARCSAYEKREIFVGLLKAAVHLRAPDGRDLVRNVSSTIERDILKHFDASGYLDNLQQAKQDLVAGLEIEDGLCENREASSPKIAKLSEHFLAAREFLVFSLSHLIISGKDEDSRSISSRILSEMNPEDKISVFGSAFIPEAVRNFKEPWMLTRVARANLLRIFPDRIAYDIKLNSSKIVKGELDKTLVMSHRAFYARFVDQAGRIKNDYIRAAKSWDKAVDEISSNSQQIDISRADGFMDYVTGKGAERHILQPALARISQDFHSRPVGRTAFDTLKSLNNHSEAQARTITLLDWPTIYAHAQLDYSFER
jgi:hypothetical protein